MSPKADPKLPRKNPLGAKKAPELLWLRQSLLWLVPPGVLILLFHVLKHSEAVMVFLVDNVTSPVKEGVSWLCDFCPIAVAEVLWTGAALAVILFLVRTVWLLIRRGERVKRLVRRTLALLTAGLYLYAGCCLMLGCNGYVPSFCENEGLEEREVSAGELYTLMVAFADEASALSEELPKDENGVTELDVDAVFDRAVSVYDALAERFPSLEGPARRPKQIVFSRVISYLDFTGFYCPFTGESTINVDQPDYLIPSTILHEISHQRNVSSEEECNFLAILAGVESDDVTFRYSSCMMAYIHLSNALYKADSELWADARTHLGDTARADNTANNEYWAQFDTPVKTVSTSTYSGFIRSYGQSEGLAMYGKCVDLLVAYYFDKCPEAQFW